LYLASGVCFDDVSWRGEVDDISEMNAKPKNKGDRETLVGDASKRGVRILALKGR